MATLKATTFKGDISYAGSNATTSMIRFLNNTIDSYGNGISIGAGGKVIIGAGESAGSFESNPGDEDLYLTSDQNVYIKSSSNNGSSFNTWTFGTDGTLSTPGTISFGTLTGNTTSNRINARHLDGQRCSDSDYNLYLQYHQSNYVTYFNGGTYYIKGGYYNGTAEASNSCNGNAASANRLIGGDTKTAISGTSRYTDGLELNRIYSSGYPFSYGVTLTMEASNFGAELIFNGLGGGGATGSGNAYFRTHSDWGSSEWGQWREILDSTNYSGYALPISGGSINGDLRLTGTNGSNASRATLNLITAADQPNDLYFGSGGNQHWSITSRGSGDDYFIGLYNAMTSNWIAKTYKNDETQFHKPVYFEDIVHGNNARGFVVQSHASGPWHEGIRILPTTTGSGYAVLALCSDNNSTPNNIFSMVMNTNGTAYLEVKNGTNQKVVNMPYVNGTMAVVSNYTNGTLTIN